MGENTLTYPTRKIDDANNVIREDKFTDMLNNLK